MRWPLQHRLYKSGLCNGRAMIWQEGTPVNTSHSMCYWSSSNPCHIIEISYGCICHNLQINYDYIIHLANSEPSATLYSEGEYCLPELPVVENRGEENKTAYQALDLDSTDYTSIYSKIQECCKQKTPTVERGDHVYAVIDSTRVEPPSQYAELK